MGMCMSVSPAVGRDGGGGITGGGDLRLLPPEHSCTVHWDQTYYGAVSVGGSDARVKGGQFVVGAGRLGLGGDVNGGSGYRIDGGGGGYTDKTYTETD